MNFVLPASRVRAVAVKPAARRSVASACACGASVWASCAPRARLPGSIFVPAVDTFAKNGSANTCQSASVVRNSRTPCSA